MNDNLTTASLESTIINRREIEPLLLRAYQLMHRYDKATGCSSLVLDTTGSAVGTIKNIPQENCELCRIIHSRSSENQNKDDFPCSLKHREFHSKTRQNGGYIHNCDSGLCYWTSPIISGGKHVGTLVSGQVLSVPHEESIKRINSFSKIPEEKLMNLLSQVPEKTNEEINAMANLLLVCAEKLSENPCKSILPVRNTKKNENVNLDLADLREKERTLLAAMRRGDRNNAMNILDNILLMIHEAGSGNFELLKLKSIELAVLLSRAAGNTDETYERYYRRLDSSSTVNELGENLRMIADSLCGKIFSFRGIRHSSALRKAERYIWENYTRKINLAEIAAASGLSAPYFSTIFKEEMGKNLSTYLNELRVEKAAGLLTGTGMPLCEITKTCGFEDQSWFSKIFKAHTGMSPAKYREQGNRKS